MKPTIVHCFFEQSGVFRNEFRKIGIRSYDYDLRDDFGNTDFKLDLFREIDDAYTGKKSIFDYIDPAQLIIAFYPCIYFNEHNEMYFCNTTFNFRNLNQLERLDKIIDRAQIRNEYYVRLIKLFAICERRQLRLIVENPYNAHHYLRFNFPYKPAVIDMNRTLRGDYFKKPTQYFFLNISPGNGKSLQKTRPMEYVQEKCKSDKAGLCSVERSMISPEYAHNFICDYILDIPSGHNEPTLLELFAANNN